ncbi:BZ3500_MvSof-1268-A1-R1_Chr1-3g02432 [Microbotryum saponariae]|uniref:BZ3500_MvSof-1268-A1-R1_Chr1-3g02432 protein n=1 Tax=Microbotryum saponariae TaxID=289078 RepID=A0A2X0KDG0_9BASI|nr:BZ3500_MvSof-1268-A1-R1_Chr1-3g02432 [Microbotryum saponariae]SCZ96219.1 BZ3501_MvSof-1269-A2-R1_Chr1-3g02035 [Microbotryum saponariae]
MTFLPRIAYPASRQRQNFLDLIKQGYWSPHTASVDHCELNYSKSEWIAEYYNTITSLVIGERSHYDAEGIDEPAQPLKLFTLMYQVILGMQAFASSIRQKFPKRFRIVSFGIVMLGITSSLHHATLDFKIQLLDELVVVWLTSLVAWIVWDMTPVAQVANWHTRITMIIVNAVFTILHALRRDPVLMELYHGWTSVLLTARLGQLLMSNAPPDSKGVQEGRRMIRSAASLGGFALIAHKADRSFCIPSTALKILVLPRLAFLLEGHAWSHVLTGLSLQRLIFGISLITMSIRDDPAHWVGMTCGWIEVVERTEQGWKALEKDSSSSRREITQAA